MKLGLSERRFFNFVPFVKGVLGAGGLSLKENKLKVQ